MPTSVEPPMIVLTHRVCGTRNLARKLIGSRPDVSPGLAVYLRCDRAEAAKLEDMPPSIRALYEEQGIEPSTELGVEVMTPSFADEILKTWPQAQLVGANRDVQISFDLALERKADG
jgi:hypothetical protein